MARTARGDLGDGLVHITARGNDRRAIFLDDLDRRSFLRLLERVVEKYDWQLHAYCLMPNHFHLVLAATGMSLSAGMRSLNGGYAQRFNQRHKRGGHLFQGRYDARPVTRQRHAEELCRYVLENPLRAGLCERVEDYPWSALLVGV
jgi:REP element-mobilizing transposase RayT